MGKTTNECWRSGVTWPLAAALTTTFLLAAPRAYGVQDAAPAPQASGAEDTTADREQSTAGGDTEETVDVAAPGGEIVVVGRRTRNLQQASTEAISVLSAEDIARTGEGNIAAALSRVTGLSLVGNGFVYVRGLGDRYSAALLNGLPLPSPEPLRRAIPLDLFPTDVIASSLVQKTYSSNFAAEFGGGVINLTTLAVPEGPFLSAAFGVSGDSETTGRLGYQYYGGERDWTGYDDGSRDLTPALRAFFASGERLSAGNVDAKAIVRGLVNGNNGLIQRNDRLPPNYSGSIAGGTSWDIGDGRLGLLATFGQGG
ncbi:MAG: TonB-dependent receptor plug domain-containing protein, partial [Steroidobacteraceae bacterium]|nr:TonB-dependent receptor plug domain-containing protein [Steroidobacteraceae bacterium]MDW8260434.1 TonB-dependent receptor plug domain-containing protein [Gammaproteobacteria bacterium]